MTHTYGRWLEVGRWHYSNGRSPNFLCVLGLQRNMHTRKLASVTVGAIHFLTSSQVSFRHSHPTWTITVSLPCSGGDHCNLTCLSDSTVVVSATYLLPATLIHSADSSFLSSTVRLRLSPVEPFTAGAPERDNFTAKTGCQLVGV